MEFRTLAIAVITVIIILILIVLAINLSGVLGSQLENATAVVRVT